MEEGERLEDQRPPRWDSYPLPGKFSTPRWDAGVRYWPGAVILGSALPLWVGLTIAFGFSNGDGFTTSSLLTAAVVASYPSALILVPIRKRLVPREVGSAASAAPMRLWVVGFFLFAAFSASCALFFRVVVDGGRPVNPILFTGLYGLEYGFLASSGWCIRKAVAWEQWRNRPRKKRGKSPLNSNDAPTGAATLGQPH
ncbi:MAG TPA: hypothetical protein VNU19_22915 [Candidatus Acidoferrum sp.]|jgi:hypothetical protein|nr:hypothetical protein [Candidatus Acidoferrum sp.]